MKLKDYAKASGVCYKTAWRWFKAGQLSAYQMPTGTIIVNLPQPSALPTKPQQTIAIYARVSSSENKSNLDSQATRLVHYCESRGYQIAYVVKEIGSGLNDKRKKLEKLLNNPEVQKIVVEHKDRLTPFGFHYIDTLLKLQGRSIEVVNHTEDEKEEIVQDFVSIISSFCARLYGQRRSKRKTEELLRSLNNNNETR
jgi:putative resolvase